GLFRHLWSRADKAHPGPDNVDQLRHLAELVPPQEPARPGQAGTVVRRARAADSVLVHDHGPELVHAKLASAHAHAPARVDGGAVAVELDPGPDAEDEWRPEYQPDRCKSDVERALGGPASAQE